MHSIIMIPFPAPDKSMFFKNSNYFKRDFIMIRKRWFFFYCPTPIVRIFNIYILPLPDVYRTKISNINANIITLLYIFFYSHSKAIIIISLVFILIKVINECYKFVKNHFIKAIIKQLFDYFNSSSSYGLDYAFVYVIASP